FRRVLFRSYRASDLPQDTYLITPTRNGYEFDPPAESFDVASDITDANFTATGLYSISGQITGAPGEVTVSLFVGPSQLLTTQSDVDGNYTINDVGPGTYSVIPSLTNYVFNPAEQIVTMPADGPNAVGVDFTALSTYRI